MAAIAVACGPAGAATGVLAVTYNSGTGTYTTGTYYYSTGYQVPADAATIYYAGEKNANGGLCAMGSAACLGNGATGLNPSGYPLSGGIAGTLISGGTTSAPGYFQISSPSTPSTLGLWQLQLKITGLEPSGAVFGNIFEVIADGQVLKTAAGKTTTSVVAWNSGTASTGTFLLNEGAGVVNTISVVNLFQQWLGTSSYDLPNLLNGSSAHTNTALGLTAETQAYFTVSASFVQVVPEPVGLSVLAAGVAGLATVRRRRVRAAA